jgi:hypothetical protein
MKIGLTVESRGALAPADLERVAAAIQVQVSRDFSPIWGIDATIGAFPSLEQVPFGYWPVILTSRRLDEDEGFYISPGGESFSVVEILPGWSVVASHIVLELLADPKGARTIAGPSPSAHFARGEYLVEVAAPCQSAACGYLVNGVLVSDFVTPSFYTPIHSADGGERVSYSIAGNVTAPYGLAPGGSITFLARDDRSVIHLTRDGNGRHRSAIFYLRDPFRDPLRPWIAALISRRRRLMRMNGLVDGPGPSRAQELYDEEMQRKRADVLRSHLALLGRSDPRSGGTSVEPQIDGDLPAVSPVADTVRGGAKTLPHNKGNEHLQGAPPPREKITLNLVESSFREQTLSGAPMICDPDVLAPYDLSTGQADGDLAACGSAEARPTAGEDFRSVTGRTK